MIEDKLTLVSEKRLRELLNHEKDILDYCKNKNNLDYMWASTIAGIILNCDFRDAKTEIRKLDEMRNG